MDLRFDNDRETQSLRGVARRGWVIYTHPLREGDAELPKDFLGLVLVNLHEEGPP